MLRRGGGGGGGGGGGNCVSAFVYAIDKLYFRWPLLLTWINFNPSMDK